MFDVLIPAAVDYSGLDRLLDGRYQVIQILDSGAWGRTYLAQDTRRPSQPECVIYHITPLVTDPDYQNAFRHLFVREAATLERLGEHSQIPRLLACFEDEQGFHLVQEFVSGDRLTLELLPNQSYTEEQVIQLLLECLEPLAAAHSECCRHGDVRPDNWIRRSQDGKLVLTNFGTVRDIHLSVLTLYGQSSPSMVFNTQGYQAPEQLQGLPCMASDVYAVGLIGIQALTGVHPTQLTQDAQTGAIRWQPFDQFAGSTLRHGLVAVLSRMVRADQTQRYASAAEAVQALRQLTQAGLLAAPAPDAIAAASLLAALDQSIEDPSTVDQSIVGSLGSRPSVFGTSVSGQSVPEHRSLTPPVPTTPDSHALVHVESPDQETLAEKMLSPAVQIGVGIGAVLAAAVCGYGLPHLLRGSLIGNSDPGSQSLAQAQQQYQAGQLQQAIQVASAIPKNSAAYTPAQDAIARWQTDWKTAERKFEAANSAFQRDDWLAVLQQAQGMPPIAYWQNRIQVLVKQSTQQADSAAAALLKTAYDRAIAKDFGGAITALTQIPAGTSVSTRAQEKLREYREKQQIQAVSYLQVAYNRAESKEFDQAIEALKQIAADAAVYPKAQTKMREYTEKQQIRAAALASPDLNPGSYLREANLAGR